MWKFLSVGAWLVTRDFSIQSETRGIIDAKWMEINGGQTQQGAPA